MQEPRYTRSDGSKVEISTPHNKPVPWKIYSRRMHVLLVDGVMARTAFGAWQEAKVTIDGVSLAFSEVECVGPKG
jgi:hypothetical protein